jgi:hypothetical protein
MHIKFWAEYLKERNQFGDLSVDERIRLMCISKK